MNRTISIIHPSRNRAEMALSVANKWINTAGCQVQYILSLDTDEKEIEQYKQCNDIIQIVQHNNKSAIEAINVAVQYTTGDILIVVSDDFDCPDNWAIKLLEQIGDKKDIVVKTQDGTQPWIMTLPIMDRTYYNRFGYIYYPGYQHMFCDTEMSHVGDLLGKTLTIPITFPHKHYTTGAMKKDSINEKNDRTWTQGETLYLKRVKENFGIENPLPIKLPSHHINWLKSKGIYV